MFYVVSDNRRTYPEICFGGGQYRGLEDGSPPAGSSGRASVGVWGQAPEAEEYIYAVANNNYCNNVLTKKPLKRVSMDISGGHVPLVLLSYVAADRCDFPIMSLSQMTTWPMRSPKQHYSITQLQWKRFMMKRYQQCCSVFTEHCKKRFDPSTEKNHRQGVIYPQLVIYLVWPFVTIHDLLIELQSPLASTVIIDPRNSPGSLVQQQQQQQQQQRQQQRQSRCNFQYYWSIDLYV